MQANFNNIEYLFPKSLDWKNWKLKNANLPFSEESIEFLNALSANLLKDKRSRQYPDVVTFAFFCRRANLLDLKERYIRKDDLRLGRGILFHIAPSNVPINFAFSLVAGLLSGNNNIVRVSSKNFPQVNLVIEHIEQLNETGLYSCCERIVLVRYDRTSDATSFFSSFCDTRIIWGGDDTIRQIRKSEIPARSFDLTFADRYSFAVLNSDVMIEKCDYKKLAQDFYNDTFLFDQNACSAPHLIVWLGNKSNQQIASDLFWKELHKLVKEKYSFQSVMGVDKLTAIYKQAVEMPIKQEVMSDNLIVRVKLECLEENIDEYRCATGYFSEFYANNISDIVPIIKRKYQTLAYYGLDSVKTINFVCENKLAGIDRIVPIGTTTDFDLTWDGYNLIDKLTRIISIK